MENETKYNYKSKKNIINFLIYILIAGVFFILGYKINDKEPTQKYYYQNFSNAKIFFDTSNGDIYIKHKNNDIIEKINYIEMYKKQKKTK